MTVLLCAIFFASGLSALVFETLWFHQAGLAFGNSVWASSLVLSGFMGGLALGNALSALRGDAIRNPIRAYAGLEAAVAFSGVALVYVLPLIGPRLAAVLGPLRPYPWIVNALRFVCAFVLLALPAAAMGMTLPLLTKALVRWRPSFGHALGRLYGWNTLGAVFGAVTAETLLIGRLGIHGTALAAGALNVAAAVTAWRVPGALPAVAPGPAPAPPAISWPAAPWLAAAFLSGFSLLALEVVWFRFLLLFVFGHALAFALMLAIVLAGIAGGGLAAAAWLRRVPRAHEWCATVALAAGALCAGSYALFPLVIARVQTAMIFDALPTLGVGMPLMFPTSFASGVLFILTGAALREHLSSETQATGALTFVNTVGAALGPLASGFLLLPAFGVENTLVLLAGTYGVIGALLLPRRSRARAIAYAAGATFLLVMAGFPFGTLDRRHHAAVVARWVDPVSSRVVAARESPSETIAYVAIERFGQPYAYRLLTNGYSMSITSFTARRYMKLYVYLPVAVHPGIKHALLISYGLGSTAKALTDTREIETIDVVDISRDILEMSRVVFPSPADDPLRDPRVRVHVEDGRYFLQTVRRRYDLITGEPPPPTVAGVVNLYTREYFRLVYERLADGGLVTYWLPLHQLSEASARSILAAFCAAFADCSLWSANGADLMMVGGRGERRPVTDAEFTQQWRDATVAAELRAVGLEEPGQLGALFIADAAQLRAMLTAVAPVSDDFPQRIRARGPRRQWHTDPWIMVDVDAARRRFEASALIAGLWPERVRAASLPYFEIQRLLNASLIAKHAIPSGARELSDREAQEFVSSMVSPAAEWPLEHVHRILTGSALMTLPLWLLGSDADLQRLLAGASAVELATPDAQLHVGIGRLAARQYALAAEALAHAEQAPALYDRAAPLRIYALAMAGDLDTARRAAADYYARRAHDDSLAGFWAWLGRHFRIDPR